LRIQCENLRPCIPEVDALIKDYYATTIASKGVPPVDFDWDFYMNLQMEDKLTLITARDDERNLLGFAMYIVMFHPQYKTTMYATCNTLAVKPECRGQGIGSKLVKASEAFLKMNSVKYMMHGYRAVYEAEPLFKKLGFTLTEQFYVKEL